MYSVVVVASIVRVDIMVGARLLGSFGVGCTCMCYLVVLLMYVCSLVYAGCMQ